MSSRVSLGLAMLVTIGLSSAVTPLAAATAGARPPEPVVRRLANGLTVAVFEDARLPLVQMQMLVPAGAAREPEGESGVANLTVQMLSLGTASRTAEVFSSAIDALGGSLGGTASREYTTVNGAFLAADFEAGLELLADAIVHPVFDQDQLGVAKDQAAAALVRGRQNPVALADEHLWAAVFPGQPYGRSPAGALRTLASLGVPQVQAFHRDHYRPDRALLAIAGDVTPERAFRAVEEVLGSWGGQAQASGPVKAPAPASGWQVRIVDVPGLARAELRVGVRGPGRSSGEHDALGVAGELLGDVGDAKLRVGVTGLEDNGLFSIATSAPVDSAGAAVARLRRILDRWATSPPNPQAVARIQRRLAASFSLQLETRSGLIAHWMAAVLRGKPDGGLADYPSRIGAVPAGTVGTAIERWITPDRMVLVAVGPAERLRTQLAAVGSVEVVSAEAAGEVVESPSTTTKPPTPEQLASGRTLVSQAVQAHGGLQRMRGIKDSSLECDVVMLSGPHEYHGDMLQLRREPRQYSLATTFRGVQSIQVLDGASGWSQAGQSGGSISDLDSLAVLGLRAGFRSDLQHLLLTAADTTSRVAFRGRERRDNRDVDVIEMVAADGERRVLFLDAASHQLVAMEQGERGHSARRLYRDLRPVDGVLWPFNEERFVDGQRTMTLNLRRVAFNVGLRDELFHRPAAPESGRGATGRPKGR
jgi:zinc protease